jgi:hypothetical protein
MVAMVVLIPVLAGLARADVDDATIVKALQEYLSGTTASFPIPPANERARLLEGKVLKARIKSADGDLALGMIVSRESLKNLWLGSLDPDFDHIKNVRTYLFPTPPDAVARWYGLVDLPRPFTDRHFLITTVLDKAIAAESGGRIWERTWSLEPDGLATMAPLVADGKVEGVDSAMFERAIYTPVNHGSWFFVQLDETRVLMGYSCATVIGGDIPEGLVTQHVLQGLDELLTAVVARAREMRAHYTGAHPLLVGGDGQPIPLAP